MSTEPFAMYITSWWIYSICGVALIALIALKARRWHFVTQTIIYSFFAASSFSFTTVPDSNTIAPTAIAMILELESESAGGFMALFWQIILIWMSLLFLMLGSYYAWLSFKPKAITKNEHQSHNENNKSHL